MTHIIITRLEVLPELPTCDRDKSGKMARMDFLPAGCHEPLVCKKCSEATHRTGGMLVSGLAPRLCLCDRLISLSLTSSRPVHVVAGVGISLPFMGYIPLRAQTTFTQSSVHGHWGCSRLLATVNHAAVKCGCTYPFEAVRDPPARTPGRGSAGPTNSMCNLLRTPHTAFPGGRAVLRSRHLCPRCRFLRILANTACFRLFVFISLWF